MALPDDDYSEYIESTPSEELQKDTGIPDIKNIIIIAVIIAAAIVVTVLIIIKQKNGNK